MAPQLLKVAFTIGPEVTLSDFIPATELLGGLNGADHPILGPIFGDVPYRVAFDFLAPTMEPVTPMFGGLGPNIVPTKTYEEALKSGTQYDILWVPAGPFPDAQSLKSRIHPSQIEFIKVQAPKAQYVMSVCAGSAILAEAGILSGKKATTNKAFYKQIVSFTPKDITWVPKARWVIDGNIWTSSGVSAGSDMAIAFIEHLVGPRIAGIIRGQAEVIVHGEGDDPFAEVHGLV
ncbi:class I glutamine amidotransferase-like protein [Flagelloscypha sp. PMI_526]|nr:class I glutamine amidotransferase-like protein [Flagelloscypha sp. PMI_526]